MKEGIRRRPRGDLDDLVSPEDGVLLAVLLVQEVGHPPLEVVAVVAPLAVLAFQHLDHQTAAAKRTHDDDSSSRIYKNSVLYLQQQISYIDQQVKFVFVSHQRYHLQSHAWVTTNL